MPTYALGTAADQEWEGFHGHHLPRPLPMLAQFPTWRYGTTVEQMAAVAVKNHANGLLNPHAQYHLKLTIKSALESTMVADPLRLMDCSPVTDGAAALIATKVENAKKLGGKRPMVTITGSGLATDTITLANREDLTELKAVRTAADPAYQMAGKKPQDLDIVEVHGYFTIAEIWLPKPIRGSSNGGRRLWRPRRG